MKRATTEGRIVNLVDAAMRKHGWLSQVWSQHQTLYLKATPVTPYFAFTGLEARPNNYYFMRGGLGVLHRGFEAHWENQTRMDEPRPYSHAFIRDIADFARFRQLSLLSTDGVFEKVVDLCVAINDFMNELPSSEEALRTGIECGVMAGEAAERFFNPVERAKSAAFRDFLAAE